MRNHTPLELKALEMIKKGKKQDDIEKELGYIFIFLKDIFTGEYVGCTQREKLEISK